MLEGSVFWGSCQFLFSGSVSALGTPCAPFFQLINWRRFAGNNHHFSNSQPAAAPKSSRKGDYSRNLLLRPLQIPAHLARVLEPLREPRARLGQARLRLGLQLEQLAVLCVEVSGSSSSLLSANHSHHSQGRRKTHVCACFTVQLSSGSGSNVSAKRSCMYSWRSMPAAEAADES